MSFVYKSPLTAQKGGGGELSITLGGSTSSSIGTLGFDTSGNYTNPTLEASSVGPYFVYVSASATVAGGTPPYSYLWESYSQTEFTYPIDTGSLLLTVEYTNGEFYDDVWTVTVTDSDSTVVSASFDLLMYGVGSDPGYIVVNPTGSDYQSAQSPALHGGSEAPMASITRAYYFAPSGSTVEVYSGSYAENVTLNKAVIIQGMEATLANYPRIASGNYFIYDTDWPTPALQRLMTGSEDRYYVKQFNTSSFNKIFVTTNGNIQNGLIECSNNSVVQLDTGTYIVTSSFYLYTGSPGKTIRLNGSPVTTTNYIPSINTSLYANSRLSPATYGAMFTYITNSFSPRTTLNVSDLKMQWESGSLGNFYFVAIDGNAANSNYISVKDVFYSWMSGSVEKEYLFGNVNYLDQPWPEYKNELASLGWDNNDIGNSGAPISIAERKDMEWEYLIFFVATQATTALNNGTPTSQTGYKGGSIGSAITTAARPRFKIISSSIWQDSYFNAKANGRIVPCFFYTTNDYANRNIVQSEWGSGAGFSGSRYIAFVFSPSTSSSSNQIYNKWGSWFSGYSIGMLPSTVSPNTLQFNFYSTPNQGDGTPTPQQTLGEVAVFTASVDSERGLYFIDAYFTGFNTGSTPILQISLFSGSSAGVFCVASQSYLYGTSSGYFSSSLLHTIPVTASYTDGYGANQGWTFFSGSKTGGPNSTTRTSFATVKYVAKYIYSATGSQEVIDIEAIRRHIAYAYFV